MRRILFLALGAAAFAACTSAPGTGDGGAGGDAGVTDAKAEKPPVDSYVPTCAEAKACEGDPPSMDAQCVVSLDTAMADPSGAPVTGEKLFFCGTNICTSPLAADPQGKIHEYLCGWFIKGAAKYLGGTKYASFASGAMTGQTAVTFPTLTLVALPQAGVDIPTSGAITSNMVSLDLASSTTVKFDPSEPNDADLHRFRAVQIPAGKFPPGTPSAVDVVWGLAPINAALSPSAKLTVPNVASWPANAAVQVYLNGADAYDAAPPAPYGGWGTIGAAHVSADGQTVSTDSGAGNGVPMLGMVGLHKM